MSRIVFHLSAEKYIVDERSRNIAARYRHTGTISMLSFPPPTSFLRSVPFTAGMPIRITIHGYIYDITRHAGGNKRKLLDYSHSRRAPTTADLFSSIRNNERRERECVPLRANRARLRIARHIYARVSVGEKIIDRSIDRTRLLCFILIFYRDATWPRILVIRRGLARDFAPIVTYLCKKDEVFYNCAISSSSLRYPDTVTINCVLSSTYARLAITKRLRRLNVMVCSSIRY